MQSIKDLREQLNKKNLSELYELRRSFGIIAENDTLDSWLRDSGGFSIFAEINSIIRKKEKE